MDSITEPSGLQTLSSSQVITLLMANTLGMSVLVETFRSAAFYLNNSDKPLGRLVDPRHFRGDLREGKESLAFINGTGLEVVIHSYYLDFNADRLRSCFFYNMRRSANGH